MGDSFTLEIAGNRLNITCDHVRLFQALSRRYRLFITDENADFQVGINWNDNSNFTEFLPPEITFKDQQIRLDGDEYEGYCDLGLECASFEIRQTSPVDAADYFLRVVSAAVIFQANGMMVHGAGILHNGKGYLFIGHSGSGKTTVSLSSVNAEVLNDDLVVLMPERHTWRIHSTPFYNPTQVKPQLLTAPLQAIYRLVQDKAVYLDTLQPGQALAGFLSNIPVIPSSVTLSEILMERCISLLREVPVYDLHFLPDNTFWQVIGG